MRLPDGLSVAGRLWGVGRRRRPTNGPAAADQRSPLRTTSTDHDDETTITTAVPAGGKSPFERSERSLWATEALLLQYVTKMRSSADAK